MRIHNQVKKKLALAEVAVFYGLALLVIWGSRSFRPPVLLVAVVMIGICVGSNYWHKDSWARIGFSKKNLVPSFKILAPLCTPLLIILLIIAGIRDVEGGWDLWFSFFGYPVWGFAQEYALLGFVANRLEDGLPRYKPFIPFINGFLFSMVHLPNPMLFGFTLVAGVLFTWVFFKKRQLIPISLAHATFGMTLSLAFGDIPGAMSVGPAYLARI